ncbi:hypothetical protein D3C76_1124990 [compost metagenome]
MFGNQVVARLSHARLSLVQVRTAADTALGAQLDLVVNPLMALEVLFSQAHEFAPRQHIQVHLCHGESGSLRSAQQGVGASIHGGLLTPHFAGRCITVKHHLREAQVRLAAVQGFPVVVAASTSSGDAVSAFTTITAQQVDPWQVSPLGRF